MLNFLRPASVILAILIVISAVLGWYFLARLLENPIGSYYDALWPAVVFSALAGLLGLSFLIVESALLALIASLLALTPFFAFFEFNAYYFGGLIFFALLFLLARQRIQREKDLALKFRVSRPLKRGLGAIFISLFFIASAAYHFSPNVQALGQKGITLPKNIFNLALPLAGGALQEQFPGFSPEKTVDEVLNEMLSRQLAELPEEIPPALLEKEKQKFLEQQRAEISKRFGVELRGNQMLGDIFYDFSAKQLNQFLQPYKEFIPIILSSGLFFTLLTFLIPFKWLAEIVALVFYKLLLVSGLILISTVKTDKEVLSI